MDCVWLPDQQDDCQVISESIPHSYNVEKSSGLYRSRHHIISMPDTVSSMEQNVHTQCSNDISDTPRITLPANDTDVVQTRSGRTIKAPNRLDTSWTL